MKRIFAFLMSLMLVLGMCGCAVTEVQAPATDPTEVVTPSDDTTENLTSSAEAILQEIVQYHVADETFIDTILTQVPDIFMLTGFRAACWTYFLEMSDGIEYIVIVDNEDYHITSISYWDPDQGVSGPTIYTDAE